MQSDSVLGTKICNIFSCNVVGSALNVRENGRMADCSCSSSDLRKCNLSCQRHASNMIMKCYM